jgi:hypothetical protein
MDRCGRKEKGGGEEEGGAIRSSDGPLFSKTGRDTGVAFAEGDC